MKKRGTKSIRNRGTRRPNIQKDLAHAEMAQVSLSINGCKEDS